MMVLECDLPNSHIKSILTAGEFKAVRLSKYQNSPTSSLKKLTVPVCFPGGTTECLLVSHLNSNCFSSEEEVHTRGVEKLVHCGLLRIYHMNLTGVTKMFKPQRVEPTENKKSQTKNSKRYRGTTKSTTLGRHSKI